MTFHRSLSARLALTLLLLLLGFGTLVAVLSQRTVAAYQDEELQRLSYGLARNIVRHWPEIAAADRDAADRMAHDTLLSMVMTVNPGVQVYVLDADGKVVSYIGPPDALRDRQVNLGPVRAFLAGAPLPLRGPDPMGAETPRLFSAAVFPSRPGDRRPPGYLYVVLDGPARQQVAAQLSHDRVWWGATIAAMAGMVATTLIGLLAFGRITLPLDRLARRMQGYSARDAETGPSASQAAVVGDEVQAIEAAFAEMTHRIERQAERERTQAAAHRETIASVAHDLRTPLTALHGHLEMLAGPAQPATEARDRVLAAALAQSGKVGRLSQQLFELATLQASDEVAHRERFRLDELVSDAVQKFEFADARPPVRLSGPPPGRVELFGDLQLVERALTNLIENALRHARAATAVRVSLRCAGPLAEILVEDSGPGLPAELLDRLNAGGSVREPPIRRSGGGVGGLGLAIAQRVAVLHGGSLRALPSPDGGARLCLALALEAAPAAE